MRYNNNTATEKPISECPKTCGNCDFFVEGSGTYAWGDTCTANGFQSPTMSFIKPLDGCLPKNLFCYWWYADAVWNSISKEKQNEYKIERLHEFVLKLMLKDITDRQERQKLIEHAYRQGGCGIIDTKLFPQAQKYIGVAKKLLAYED